MPIAPPPWTACVFANGAFMKQTMPAVIFPRTRRRLRRLTSLNQQSTPSLNRREHVSKGGVNGGSNLGFHVRNPGLISISTISRGMEGLQVGRCCWTNARAALLLYEVVYCYRRAISTRTV